MFMQKFGGQIRCIVGDKQFAYCKFNDWFTTAELKVARDTFGSLSCKKLRRMHEVQRLISTSLRDMNNWIHECYMSVHVQCCTETANKMFIQK